MPRKGRAPESPDGGKTSPALGASARRKRGCFVRNFLMTRFQIVGPASLPELSSCRADGENTIPELRSPAPRNQRRAVFLLF